MSSFRQLMMKAKGLTPNPPENTVFTQAGDTFPLTKNFTRTWNKDYDGLCYGCVIYLEGGWQIPFFVSTDKNACSWSGTDQWTHYSMEITDTPINYLGKNWYYTTGTSGLNAPSNNLNGRYLLKDGLYFPSALQTSEIAKIFLNVIYGIPDTDIYSQVDYIQTSGSQYIDTGIVPTSNTRVVTKIGVTTSTQNLPVFGCLGSNSSGYYHLTCFNSKWYWGTNGGEGNGGSYNASSGQLYEIDFNNSGSIIINNSTIATGVYTIGNGNLAISKRSISTDPRYGAYRYYSFKVYDNGVLVRDFVPVLNIGTLKYGMLEQVNNVFYGNDGSGNITGGND